MSSVDEFLDFLLLGIFIILSPAFDNRFYSKPASTLSKEASNAVAHFYSLLNTFSLRFIVLLDGESIAHSYIFHRLLAEFAAASVVFSKGLHVARGGEGDGITFFNFMRQVEGILEAAYPSIFDYYSQCYNRGHKSFIWSGPAIDILHRTEALDSLLSSTSGGELLELPYHPIYATKKRHDRGDSIEIERPNKRKR